MNDLAFELENDIDYLLHVEHEIPMERYIELRPFVEELAQIWSKRIDDEVQAALVRAKYDVSAALQSEVSQLISRAVPKRSLSKW